jgi:hypothetical protein
MQSVVGILVLFRDLFFLGKALVLEGESLVVFPALLAALAVRTLHVEVPAVPLLEPAAVEEQLLLGLLLGCEVDGRGHSAGEQVGEVELCEEGVLLDLLSAVVVAQPLLRVDLEEAVEEGFGLSRQVVGQRDWLGDEVLEHGALVVGEEGRPTRQHVVDQRAEAEPVRRLRVPLPQNDLGSDVLGSTAQAVGLLAGRVHDLAKSEVRNLHVTFCVQQDVLRL